MTFCVGDAVEKVRGYEFPGWVRAVFLTRAGETRYVVEHALSPGLLHIFAPEQLKRRQT